MKVKEFYIKYIRVKMMNKRCGNAQRHLFKRCYHCGGFGKPHYPFIHKDSCRADGPTRYV